MPMPVGGAFALHGSMAPHWEGVTREPDPELTEYREQQHYILENLSCKVKFFKGVIPPGGGVMQGAMVLETREEIEHSGMFVLMKGLPLGGTKKKQGTRKPMSSVKFTVLGSTYSSEGGEDGGEVMVIEEGSRVSYPLEIDVPEELPQPFITSEGKLIYKMQVFLSTSEGRHVHVGQTSIRWQGRRELTGEEMDMTLKLEQEVAAKRGYLGFLGKRNTAQLEWRIAKGACLPGELVLVELWGETKDQVKMEVECKVELFQKVWYQVPSTSRGGRMWVKMKINKLSGGGSPEAIEMEGVMDEKKLLWRAMLPIPRGLTPTSEFDFTNSISYTIKGSVGVAGEGKESWITGEVPLLIGTSREVETEEVDAAPKEEEAEEAEEEHEEEDEIGSPDTPSPVPLEELHRTQRAIGGAARFRARSQSICVSSRWTRPRSGSLTSLTSVTTCQTLASSTLSVFRLPPDYSQLSSRRPTLETLPPYNSDLALPAILVQDTDDTTADPEPSRPASACSLPPELASGEVDPEEEA